MDLRQLKYFVAVVEERNIGRAAARLHIAQPPLSRQIKHLEDALGVPLFLRTPRGVEVTNAGALLHEEAHNILALVGRAEERTRLAGQGRLGRIDIGVFGTNVLAIPDLLLAFRKRHPRVDVVLHTMNKDDQIEGLRERQIAAGFNLLGVKLADIASTVVKREHMIVALRRDHPLAKRKSIALKQLCAHPLVIYASGPRPNLVDVVFGLFQKEGLQPQIAQEVVDSVAAIALVAAGTGPCLVPEHAAVLHMPGVIYRPLRNGRSTLVELHCIFRRDDESPILRAFLSTIEADPVEANRTKR